MALNKASLAEIEKKLKAFFDDLTGAFNKTYGIKPTGKPKNIHEAIERKRNNQPFYKDSNKKPWE